MTRREFIIHRYAHYLSLGTDRDVALQKATDEARHARKLFTKTWMDNQLSAVETALHKANAKVDSLEESLGQAKEGLIKSLQTNYPACDLPVGTPREAAYQEMLNYLKEHFREFEPYDGQGGTWAIRTIKSLQEAIEESQAALDTYNHFDDSMDQTDRELERLRTVEVMFGELIIGLAVIRERMAKVMAGEKHDLSDRRRSIVNAEFLRDLDAAVASTKTHAAYNKAIGNVGDLRNERDRLRGALADLIAAFGFEDNGTTCGFHGKWNDIMQAFQRADGVLKGFPEESRESAA
ncbi:MAG: hypothetical protein AMXMBFR84_26320 [Candidatus Hydrogenedentota bacterium]